jgi:transcriptional regulator with XRE-family HTH domain
MDLMDDEIQLGRPSKYQEHFCQMLIEHMSKGLSFESFAGVIGVSRDTVYRWARDIAAFDEAKEIGTSKSLLLWEKIGIDGVWDLTEYENGKPSFSKRLNTASWIFNMKNRFKWRDRDPEEQTAEEPEEYERPDSMRTD